jgi:hypothetical protein
VRRAILIASFCFVSSQGWATAPSIVQSTGAAGQGVSTIAAPFNSNISIGSCIVVICGTGGAGLLQPFDSLKSTYAFATTSTVSGTINIYYSTAAAAGGANTVTCRMSGAADQMHVAAYEVGNCATSNPLGNVGNGSATAPNLSVTASSATVQNNAVVIVGFYDFNNTDLTYSLASGMSNLQFSHANGTDSMGCATKNVTTTGTQTGTMTVGGTVAQGAVLADFYGTATASNAGFNKAGKLMRMEE